MHEARQHIKALKAQISQLEALPKLTADDAALLKELREARTAAQTQPPDFLADPKGYVDAGLKTVRDDVEAAKKSNEAIKKTTDEQTARQQLYAQTAAAEQQFVQTAPDYPQALEHVRGIQRRQLARAHPEATVDQIAQHIAFIEMQTAQLILQQGRNPAEYAYDVAKDWGYQPQKAAPQNAARTNGTGARVDKDAARSLGSGGSDMAGADGADDGDGLQEFHAARAERFARRRSN